MAGVRVWLLQEAMYYYTQPVGTVARVLSDLRDVIASGLFVHTPSEDACKWCEHGLACGRGVQTRAGAKLGDARLGPFLRLTQYE